MGSTAAEDPKVRHGHLLDLLKILRRLDSVPLDLLVPAFLGIVVAGMICAVRIREYACIPYIVTNGKGVRLDNLKYRKAASLA